MFRSKNESSNFASDHLDRFERQRVRGHLARAEQPSDRGGVISNGEDAFGICGRVEAFDPHVHSHPDELEQVVESLVAAERARRRDSDPPGKTVKVVTAYPIGAGVGPADPSRLPNCNPVQ